MRLSPNLPSVRDIDDFIRAYWQVVPDPDGIEYVSSPEVQLCRFEQAGTLEGDCDDAATLAAALVLALGSTSCSFVAIRFPAEAEFSHVFTRTSERDIDPIVELDILPHRSYAEKIELMV